MIGAQTAPPAESLPEALRELAKGLARHDAAGVAARIAPLVRRFESTPSGDSLASLVDAVSVVCRELYGHGRASEALPLASGLHGYCQRAGDRVQFRRATFLCAMLYGEGADLVRAIEHYVEALRMAAAEDDRVEMARVWGNLGCLFGNAGRHELAVGCHRRCLRLLDPLVQANSVRRIALSNLAQSHYHLGQVEEGIRSGQRALRETGALGSEDPFGGILLRRNMARLLLEAGLTEEAEEHVAHAIVLAQATGTPRALIAAEMTRAAHDLATGNADLALTRIERTIAHARQVPSALYDALSCAVRAEEAAGYPARALLRLQELSDHMSAHAVERARAAIEGAGMDAADRAALNLEDLARQRLASQLDRPQPPQAWTTLRRLAASAVLPMDSSGWHGVRVGTLVKALAIAHGCGPLQSLELGLAAELHDIGMTSVPAAVLSKDGVFNDAERSVLRRHAEAGAAMLVGEPHPRLLLAREIALYHHARWDGTGHPERVAGDAIPLGARMCAIADAYDAMVCGLGRPRLTMAQALAELRRCAGQQFDPELVSCFDAVVNGEMEGLGLDPASAHGMEAFQDLVAALREDRGFV